MHRDILRKAADKAKWCYLCAITRFVSARVI
jgi:hypothetical protein